MENYGTFTSGTFAETDNNYLSRNAVGARRQVKNKIKYLTVVYATVVYANIPEVKFSI